MHVLSSTRDPSHALNVRTNARELKPPSQEPPQLARPPAILPSIQSRAARLVLAVDAPFLLVIAPPVHLAALPVAAGEHQVHREVGHGEDGQQEVELVEVALVE